MDVVQDTAWGPGAPYYPHIEWMSWGVFGYACGCEKGTDHE